MSTYRSRNRINNSINLKTSYTLNTIKIENKITPKNEILTNLTEYAGEARTIIHYNNLLKKKNFKYKKR